MYILYIIFNGIFELRKYQTIVFPFMRTSEFILREWMHVFLQVSLCS